MIEIESRYSGSMIGDYRISENKIYATLKSEGLSCVDGLCHDYNWHFAFGIKNTSKQQIEVEIYINCHSEDEVPDIPPIIYSSDSVNGEYGVIDLVSSKTDTYRKYFLRVEVPVGKTVYIANFYFRAYEKLHPYFNKIVVDTRFEKHIYGKSADQHDLVVYKFKPDEKSSGLKRPSILITSGFHFPEQDTIATEAILEYLVQEQHLEKYRNFNIYIIPLVNPDGYIHGFNGCNTAGINLYWNFITNQKEKAPETYHLWNLIIDEIKPDVFFDFHSYTFQLHRKHASCYMKHPRLYKNGRVRRMVKSVNMQIKSECDDLIYKGLMTYAPSTLGMRLIKKFNTISYAKFHIHFSDGTAKSKSIALNSVLHAMDEYNHSLLNDAGQSGTNIFDTLYRKLILNLYISFFLLVSHSYSVVNKILKWGK